MAARKSGRNYTQLIEELVDLAMGATAGEAGATVRNGSALLDLPQLQSHPAAGRADELIDLVRRPLLSRAERMRDDAGARFELTFQPGLELRVAGREDVQGHHRRRRDVGLMAFSCRNSTQTDSWPFPRWPASTRLRFGESMSTPTPRARPPGRRNRDPAVAAAEVVDDVLGGVPGKNQHSVNDVLRTRDIWRQDLPGGATRQRRAGRDAQNSFIS